MSRNRLCFLASVVLLGYSPSVPGSEPDRDTLRKELAELKTMAAELQTRIAAIEEKLEPKSSRRELRINDIVVVDIAVTKQGDDLPRTAVLPAEEAPLVRHFYALIEDIHSNGDLVLHGHRRITNNEEVHLETLSGIVARDCIDSSRHVRSHVIRDLTFEVTVLAQR